MRTISKIMMGLFIGMMMSLVVSSCAKENQYQQNVIGEWKISQLFITYYENGVEQKTVEEENFFNYYNFDFKADGTFEQIMPAWEEKNMGKYTISGDLITFELTSLAWLWDRSESGYDNVYDQYGCFWNPDKYDENRTQYPDPFAKFCEEFPGRARGSAKFSFDKDGHLLLEAKEGEIAGFGRKLIYHKNPGYVPVQPEY